MIMKFVVVLVAMLFSLPAIAEPVSKIVDGGVSSGKQLNCTAYLTVPTQLNGQVPKLAFKMGGTGTYTTYFDHPKTGSVYYLTLDKPGILPNPDDRGKPIIDRAAYDFYTMNTLISCAQNALNWAHDYVKSKQSSIILYGHSEGTVVLTNVLYHLYSDKNKQQLQENVKAFFLSGAIVQNMSDVLAFQFKGKEFMELNKAYRKRDYDGIYNRYTVGWHWMDDILNPDKSKRVTLSALSKFPLGRKLPIEIFQGLRDEAVPTKAVKALEKKNNLNLHARYYETGHEMNEVALFDIRIIFDYYLGKKE